MPISRYQIRNVYSLADPELYKAADKDDPEALLEGVTMAGLVGVLRQLGDLAEFAAEIFHDLHEEVMVTASRGHGLLVRVQQLESEFPSIERAFLSQTSYSKFFPNPGIDWHPNRQIEQNLITRGDLPRFLMDSYEESRGPPRLFLLDKFDVAGAGACLKRYTDPSFYKVEASSYETASAETQRDTKIRKTKKKGSQWKGGETPEVSQPSHVKLRQLFLEERVQNGAIEPERRVKLKKRPNRFPFDLENGKGYMEKLLNSPSEDKLVHEVPLRSSTLRLPPDNSNGSRLEILEGSMVISSFHPTDNLPEKTASELPTSSIDLGLQEEVHEKHITIDSEIRTDGYGSDDVASETDNYVDALATMESELETDAAKTDPNINQETFSESNVEQLQSQFSDSLSIDNSYSDTTSTSAENTSPVGVESPPQAFASTEIPFRPRVSPNQVSNEKIPDDKILNDSCITSADQVEFLEESNENGENLDSKRKTEERHVDVLPTADNLSSSSSSVRDSEHPNDTNQAEYAEDIHSTGSVDSQSSSPHSVLSHADVNPCETTFRDDILVAEETADNRYSLPEEQLKDITRISDLPEARVSYSSEDETEFNNPEIKVVTVNDYSVFEDKTELEEKEIESVNSETKVFVPDDVDRSEDKGVFTLEDDKELDGRETETSVAVLHPVDFDMNEDNDLSNEEPDVKNSMESHDSDSPSTNSDQNLSVLEETDQNGLQEVVLRDFNHSNVQLLDNSPNSTVFTEAEQLSPLEDKVDQVKHSSTPLFSGFDMLPQLAPVNLEEMPPLPPLPPMQWLTKTLQNDHFPPIFPSQVSGHPSLDTENQKFQDCYEDSSGGIESFSRMSEEHDNLFVSSEAKISENLFSSDPSSLVPIDDERPNGIRPMKIHRPRSPLIDAVATHDKSKLRKVSERAMSQTQKAEESDTLLEQIRTKSFNLKPAVHTRPSIQGPKTNLRVAAILEKANAIRQAFAGSDDNDDDSDSWSDS